MELSNSDISRVAFKLLMEFKDISTTIPCKIKYIPIPLFRVSGAPIQNKLYPTNHQVVFSSEKKANVMSTVINVCESNWNGYSFCSIKPEKKEAVILGLQYYHYVLSRYVTIAPEELGGAVEVIYQQQEDGNQFV